MTGEMRSPEEEAAAKEMEERSRQCLQSERDNFGQEIEDRKLNYENIKFFLLSLFRDLKTGDPGDVQVTKRIKDDYKRFLGLDNLHIGQEAKVLDIGTGLASIEAKSFGLEEGNFVKSDLDPKADDILKANILDLPFSNDQFDEVWALLVFRYIDFKLPSQVSQKIEMISTDLSIPYRRLYDNFCRILGLVALKEMLRVVKVGGMIRIGGYEHNFQEGKLIEELFVAKSAGFLEDVRLGATEISKSSMRESTDEANCILFKDKKIDFDGMEKYIVERCRSLFGSNAEMIFVES